MIVSRCKNAILKAYNHRLYIFIILNKSVSLLSIFERNEMFKIQRFSKTQTSFLKNMATFFAV